MSEGETVELNVLFFGATADVVGARSVAIQVPVGALSGEAFQKVVNTYPQLANHKLLYSLNQGYARGDEPLGPGDELAVFTAVSGG